jgi:hypothetical protein
LNSIASSKLLIVGWPRLVPTTLLLPMNIEAEWGPIDPSSPTRGASSKRTSTIAEYTDLVNNPLIPQVIVLEPGLVIYKIYNGYWFRGRPTVEELRQDLRAVSKKCRPTGTSPHPNSKRRGSKAARNSSIRTEKPMSKLSASRTRTSDRSRNCGESPCRTDRRKLFRQGSTFTVRLRRCAGPAPTLEISNGRSG